MNYTIKLLTPALFVGALLLTGCSEYPEQDYEDARTALVTADSLEADLYAAELYHAAADSFDAAHLELEAQKGQSPGDRSYDRAREMLQYAKNTADQAAAVAPENREAVRLEAESLLAEAEQLIASAVPVTPDVALVSGVPAPGQQLQDARSAFESGNYLQARDLAAALVTSLKVVPQETAGISDQS
jgi:hypothetical protein